MYDFTRDSVILQGHSRIVVSTELVLKLISLDVALFVRTENWNWK